MKVAVLGAGVVGVATAWELLRDGHEVEVIDRGAEPANFSSHANAGCVGAGFALAWGSPRAPRTMLRSMLRRDQMVRFRPRLDPALWRWVRAFLRECTAEAAARNSRDMARLCVYSQSILRAVVAETGVDYDRRTGGLIYYFRSRNGMDAAARAAPLLEQSGVRLEIVDGGEVVRRNPGLGAPGAAGAAEPIIGGLHALDDESGDARRFTLALADACRAAGAVFRMETRITGLRVAGGALDGIETDRGRVEADACVLCLGVESPRLLRPLGVRLPIYPVKGYSLTSPVGSGHAPPDLGGVDVDWGLAFSPMGNRLRMTRTVEFAGYDMRHRPRDFRVMLDKARGAFPAAADFGRAIPWAGLRPMTPTGAPIIAASPVRGLWLNTGQGNFGWTMACGSARILADLLAGRTPAIAMDGLGWRG